MPPRTNWFQDLIARIEGSLAPVGVKVTQSKMLEDRDTGEDREVDVCLEIDYGNGRIFTCGIHCRDHKRKAGVQWIEQVQGMQNSLYIDKTVLVSRSGFTETAIEKAHKNKMIIMNFEEAKRNDWARLILHDVSMHMSYIKPLSVTVLSKDNQKGLFSYLKNQNIDVFDRVIMLPDGSSSSIGMLVREQITSQKMHDEMNDKYESDSDVTINCPLKPGAKIANFSVSEVRIHTRFTKAKVNIPLDSAVYQEAQITHGEGEVFDTSIKVLASEQKKGDPIIEIHIDSQKK